MHAFLLVALALAALAAGCSCGSAREMPDASSDSGPIPTDSGPVPSDGGPPPSDAGTFPSGFRVEGTAATPDGEPGVRCTFFADVIDVRASGDGWTGVASGEVFRRTVDAAGKQTFEFQALIGGEVSLAATSDGAEVRLFGDQPDDAMPFWAQTEVLAGESTGTHAWAGDWTCAPILPDDGPEGDSDRTGTGTWTIEPVP